MISSPSPSTSIPDISKGMFIVHVIIKCEHVIFMSILDVDPHLVRVIDIILGEPHVKDKWFHFGFELDISVNQLSTFECRLQHYTHCTREVVIFWRKKNMSETWIPVAQALHFAGLHTSEKQIIQHFAATESEYI